MKTLLLELFKPPRIFTAIRICASAALPAKCFIVALAGLLEPSLRFV